MRGRLHLILGTDTPASDVIRLGMGPWLRSLIEAYGRSFDVEVYSLDRKNLSRELGATHHPCPAPALLPKAIRQAVFHVSLVLRSRRMRGLVRTQSPNLPLLPEIRRFSRSPVIVDYRYDWASTSKRHYGGIKGWLAGSVQRRCLAAADLVVATTPDLAREVETRHGKRTITIPNFVDTDIFRPREPRGETILFAGRFHWAKGIPVLIDAFALIAPSHPRAELLLFGSGELDGELRARVPDSLRERIRFHGSRPQEEMAEQLGSASICALPTLTTEGNPKAVIEAMACGTPLVCSAVPGIENIIDSEATGILVQPGNAEALAGALARLLDDRPLWERISRASLARGRRFGKERILRRQIRVMQICAAEGWKARSPRGAGAAGAPARAASYNGRVEHSAVAVVIVAYGAQKPLERCLRSVARQSGAKAARVVVIDNNPPDRRCDAGRLRDAAGADVPLEVMTPGENIGYGRAVNFALDRLREDLVLVSNPDLVLEPTLLARLQEALLSHPAAAAAGPRLVSPDGAAAALSTHPPLLREEIAGLAGIDHVLWGKRIEPAESAAIAPVDFLSGACFLVHRRVIASVGGFDPRFFLYYEDADLFRRLRAEGRELLLSGGAVAVHEQGGTWSDPARRQAAAFRGALLYHRKHGGAGAGIVYRAGLLFLYAPRLCLGGLVMGLLGRRSIFTFRDRIRLLGKTLRVALSMGRDSLGTPARVVPDPRVGGKTQDKKPHADDRERSAGVPGEGGRP